MFVSGFTFVRNAIKLDYPIVEAISSILPLCDEIVVAVGNSEDNTRELIMSIDSPKIRIIDTIWDDSLREGGRVLAIETDKAFKAINPKADWAFYIQADEVLHEKYYDEVTNKMEHYLYRKNIDGLLFGYKHFYGNYDYVGDSFRWYRNEIRIIRNDPTIYSYRDAQGFRKGNNKKLRVAKINAEIYHYGWVKHPQKQAMKRKEFSKLYHDDDWLKENLEHIEEFDYSSIDSLELFEGTHPNVMLKRIAEKNWNFQFDTRIKRYSFKEKIRRIYYRFTKKILGEYRNYIQIE